MPYRNKRVGPAGKLILAVIVVLVIVALTAGNGRSATAATANRCPVTITPNSIAYSCWAAYAEGFTFSGASFSQYRASWSVTCDGQTVQKSEPPQRAFFIHVWRGSIETKERAAFELMIHHDICKFDAVATRASGSGRILVHFFINRNDPLPAHN